MEQPVRRPLTHWWTDAVVVCGAGVLAYGCSGFAGGSFLTGGWSLAFDESARRQMAIGAALVAGGLLNHIRVIPRR